MIDVSIRLRRGICVDNLLIVKRILKNNPNSVFNPDLAGNTSLHLAARHGRLEIVRYFVEDAGHEYDSVSRNSGGDTPLMVAAAAGHDDVVRFLAARFAASIDWRNRAGVTAGMMAAMGGRDGAVNVLLDMGADPEVVDGLGNTALHYASAYGHLKVIRTLLERGAVVDRPNRQGWMPVSYSCTFEAEQYFQQLVQEREMRRMEMDGSGGASARARARAATPVFGRIEGSGVVASSPGRQRASSGN